ncbi:MAG: MtnX-like HAD-IB family phosphatase [Candidatus Omnitrophica bacterium]|nr:MtnX-like HAD-IB family phosphatase [Candidatus Omnitrophota bacterium]
MPFVNRLNQLESASQFKSHIVLSNCRVFFDFDNTMTTSDVLDDVIQRFSINDRWAALEKSWEDEKISTKECLTGQLKNVRLSKNALHKFLRKVELDPHFHQFLSLLVREGVKPVILSDNFTYIVEWILAYHGIKDLKVYANSLRFYRDRIIPSFPYDNPFCLNCAHCKKIHLTKDKTENKLIVYVGDGRSDFCPARVSDVVFAKGTLLDFMNKEGLPVIAYKDLSDVHHYFKEVLTSGRKNR